MFNQTSMVTGGVWVSLLSLILTPSEADTIVGNTINIINAAGPIIGIIMAYWGRYRQGDITWYGKKL